MTSKTSCRNEVPDLNRCDYDIAIIGGGLVGASLGCALAGTRMRVAVIEAVAFKSDSQPSYDDRILAIAQGSKRILDAIGVWSEIAATDATPIKTIHISDRGLFGFTRLDHASHGVEALGYAVPARVLGLALIRQLEHAPQVTIMCPARVSDIEMQSDRVNLAVASSSQNIERLNARLVVFADGAESDLRGRLGFEAGVCDYNQSAVLTVVTPERAHNNRAYERFTDSGPLALLPTSGNRYGVVWTAREEQLKDLLECSNSDFLHRLQQRFGDRLGMLRKPGKRRSYPLSFLKVKHPVQYRAVVVGNAAHTVHPVAGQGFNLGLRDVSALAQVVYDAHEDGLDIGDMKILDGYRQWRARDVDRVGWFTDGLIRVFANDSFSLGLLRNAAMVGVDLVPPLQRALVRRTMGLAGKLPRLSRGLPLGS